METLEATEARTEGVKAIEMYPEEGKVRILDVTLDIMPLPEDVSARRFIPQWKAMEASVCWDTPTVLLIRDMAIRLSGGIPSRSEGPTGVSKSFAVEVLAALTQRSYLRHNYSKDSDPGDTIGRFVPSDSRIAVRFEELLASNLNPESKSIIENAKTQNRPLTIYESRQISRNEGVTGLEDTKDWRWQNGTLAGSMAYGSVFSADEPNLAPGNVVERENSALEKKPALRIVEHEGEIIRQLTPEEQSIIDNGGVIPGVIGLSQSYWYNASQNPWGIGGGRIEESEARRNRLQDRIVESLTPKEYEEYLNFLIHGEQPDINWQNKIYKGERDVKTNYRDLENIPHVDVLIKWLASFQSDIQALVEKGRIGSEKDIKGGSYVYSRRNMERFLDTLKGAQTALIDVDQLFKTGKVVYNTSWRDLVTEAIYQEYLAGMYKEDQDVINDVIEASGITERLGISKNNPTIPEWIKEANRKGIQVQDDNGQWTISRAELTAQDISVEDIVGDLDYAASTSGDNITLVRNIKSVAELFTQRDGQVPADALSLERESIGG